MISVILSSFAAIALGAAPTVLHLVEVHLLRGILGPSRFDCTRFDANTVRPGRIALMCHRPTSTSQQGGERA